MNKNIFINGRFLSQKITGVQRYSIELVKSIDHLISEDPTYQGIEYILLVPNGALTTHLKLKNIKIKKVGHLKGHAWEQISLAMHLKKIKKGVLFCPGNLAPIFNTKKINLITTLHSISFKLFPQSYSLAFKSFYNALIPLILKKSSLVITVSESEKKEITKVYRKKEKIKVIQNGSTTLTKNKIETLARPLKEKYILYVGSLSKGKNIQNFIKAGIHLIKNKYSGLKFVIAGNINPSFSKQTLNIPKEHSKSFIFTGHLADFSDLAAYYKYAECFVFPSFYEASPLPPIEAMNLGCPVIVSKIDSLQERCKDAALFCNPQKAQDIASCVIQILESKILKEELKQKGLHLSQQYTWKNCAKKTLDTLIKHF